MAAVPEVVAAGVVAPPVARVLREAAPVVLDVPVVRDRVPPVVPVARVVLDVPVVREAPARGVVPVVREREVAPVVPVVVPVVRDRVPAVRAAVPAVRAVREVVPVVREVVVRAGVRVVAPRAVVRPARVPGVVVLVVRVVARAAGRAGRSSDGSPPALRPAAAQARWAITVPAPIAAATGHSSSPSTASRPRPP
ncbi:hypothetical protein Skr01_45960 [Sphaerisporangium krabiense]|uniref:Uncharacterized protein n=1 Tax=Sphaerisporangium krabiense TaxID=763782 RepID=A0A7W9DQS6_9ACTN|nr:hypothetical protein [Sphaerisporangium krabiense]MBB5627354.1 hypothetical protein [Sphaerisporangium krabiense]GII64511.1 hypothetical protein Skr01_45960 [Sphaerisporangium krabiense]